MRRREDPRLITGAGRYTSDVAPAGCLHAYFVRSPFAYARVGAIEAGRPDDGAGDHRRSEREEVRHEMAEASLTAPKVAKVA